MNETLALPLVSGTFPLFSPSELEFLERSKLKVEAPAGEPETQTSFVVF